MKPAKIFAAERLPECPLKELLLLEDDKVDVHTFLARLPLWLRLTKNLGR